MRYIYVLQNDSQLSNSTIRKAKALYDYEPAVDSPYKSHDQEVKLEEGSPVLVIGSPRPDGFCDVQVLSHANFRQQKSYKAGGNLCVSEGAQRWSESNADRSPTGEKLPLLFVSSTKVFYASQEKVALFPHST